jgi:uncharacterized protein YjiS (DUF1127 family)
MFVKQILFNTYYNLTVRISNMKLLQLAVSSVVGATTGSHLTQTSNRTSQPQDSQYQTPQTGRSILPFIRNKLASVLRLVNRLAAANKQRLQRRKDTIQIFQLNAHYLKDIGLTYDDLADLRSGQRSLNQLNTMRFENQKSFSPRLKKVATSKIKASSLKAANQQHGEFASCG